MEEMGEGELVGVQDDGDERHFLGRNAMVCREENFKPLLIGSLPGTRKRVGAWNFDHTTHLFTKVNKNVCRIGSRE